MNWQQLDRLVMFAMGFVYAVIIFFFIPELWKDIKEDFRILTKEENSPDGTGESVKKKSVN